MVIEFGWLVIPRDSTIVTDPSALSTAVWPLMELRASGTPGRDPQRQDGSQSSAFHRAAVMEAPTRIGHSHAKFATTSPT